MIGRAWVEGLSVGGANGYLDLITFVEGKSYRYYLFASVFFQADDSVQHRSLGRRI